MRRTTAAIAHSRNPLPADCRQLNRHMPTLAARALRIAVWAGSRSGPDAGFSPPIGLDSRVHIHLPGVIPMIRVTKTEERSRTIVTIDGQLSGDSITVVETCCSQAEANRKPVCLFLRDVTTVDQAGTLLLRRLAAKGIRLLAHGLYTSYLVQTLGARHTA
jgi:hypothetical protein